MSAVTRTDLLVMQWSDDSPWHDMARPTDVTDVPFKQAKEMAESLLSNWVEQYPSTNEEYRVVRRITTSEEEVFAE